MRALLGFSVGLVLAASSPAMAEPFLILLYEDRTGSQEIEALHGEQGFRLGLDYATKGTLRVRGRDIQVIILEALAHPENEADSLTRVLRDVKVDIAVALGSSATAAALLPAAAAAKRILIVAQAPADALTGGAASRYVFRTAPSNSQQALAAVMALGRPELNLLAVAEDTEDGRDAVAAFKAALEQVPRGVFFAGVHYVARDEPNIGAAVSSEYDDFHYLHGAKTLLTIWTGAHAPLDAIAATNPGRFGIRLAFSGDLDPNLPRSGPRPELEGITSYFHSLPRNPVNDWLIDAWQKRTHERPDGFAANGMTAALAIVAALAKSPTSETEALISSLEGLSFETPKGRMTIRPEDHQALQPMYQFRFEAGPASDVPELVREIKSAEIPLLVQPRQK